MAELDVEQLSEIAECLGIQLEKLKKLTDLDDDNLTERFKVIDAIQFDLGNIKERLK